MNKPEIRFKGFEEDWQMESIGTYYDFKNGLNKSKEYFGYGIPIVNFTDVFHNRGLLTAQLNGKVDVNIDEIKNYSVKKGDLFFTRTSETIEEIGQPSVMLDEPDQAVFSGFVLRARAISEDPLDIDFKQYAFFTNSFRSEMVKKSSMTTRALTSGTAIKKMLFSFPKSKEEQKLIGNFFENIDRLIAEHQQKHTKLKSLKQAMLEKMFPKKGQLVPEIRFKGFEGNWEEKELKFISKIKTGYSNRVDSGESGNYAFFDRSDDIRRSNIYLFDCEAIIVAGEGSEFIPKYFKGKFDLHQRTYAIFNFNEVEAMFLFYYIYLNRKYFFNQAVGSTVKSLRLPIFENMPIVFPLQKNEQIKIANYFKNLDELIRNHETQITKLQILKKAFLSKMFI